MQLKHIIAGLAPGMVSGRVLLRRAVVCDFSVVPDSGATCDSFAAGWGSSVDVLKALNPGITCPGLDTSKEYCVAGTVTDDPPVTISTQSSTAAQSPTITPSSSTTRSSTTISSATPSSTPGPIQDGMVGNCNKFHWVQKDQKCTAIAALYSISVAQFTQWNPAAKSDCSGLWAETYACVGIIGGTPTQPGNGIATPQPTHPGNIISNCNKFVRVNAGDTCDIIAFYNGPISTDDFVLWNSGVGGHDCRNLQVDTYVCIGITADTPNSIPTPLPTHPGMVSNCNKFVRVNAGDSCDAIAFWNGVAGTEWVKRWNTGVGSDCQSLQSDTYACIGVVGGTPTQPGNGIATPQPTHPGMVSDCNKFVKVKTGDTCDAIAFWNGVAGTEWVKLWNTGVGSDCRSLQADTYVCIGVIGGTPTQPGNGVTTPQPAHPGMVSNCNKFTRVNPGDTCDAIAFYNGVAGTEWVKLWNTGVGPDCRTLQAHTYVCIGVM